MTVDPVFTWPEGVTAAAAFTFDVDAESCVLAHDPAAANRMSLMSHQAYGPRVAMPKLLRILDRQGIRATFFVPGFTAECHPEMARAIVDAGHEIGHHGYLHEQMQGIDRDTEARYLDRGLDALRRVAGVEPTGYRAPWWEMNWHTPELLRERGFRYDSSLLDGDAPYRFAVGPGRPTPSSRSRSTGPSTTGSSTPSTRAGPAAASSRARPRPGSCGCWRRRPSTGRAGAGC